jgi:opine dehydrogenase
MFSKPIGIIGTGNSAFALGAYLAASNFKVIIYGRNLEKIKKLQDDPNIEASGMLNGKFPVMKATSEVNFLTKNCSIIFVATTSLDYVNVATTFAPHLNQDHIIILFSGKLCGSLEFLKTLQAHNCRCENVIETDSLFPARIEPSGGINIKSMKQWTLYSSPQKKQTQKLGPILKNFFPRLQEADNLIQRGLTDFGAIAHASITLMNLNKIDRGESFLFYYEGVSKNTVPILEQLETEFQNVAKCYDTTILPMKDILNQYYGCNSESLLSAIQSVPCYKNSISPPTLNHRYFKEDILCTLAPCQSLAKKANISTPMIDSIMTISSLINGKEFIYQSRNLTKLGWENLNTEQINHWMKV